MKITAHIFILGILLTVFSCRQAHKKKEATVGKPDTLQNTIPQKEDIEKTRSFEEEEYADSLRHDKILQSALKIATKNFSNDKFIYSYVDLPDSIPVRVEINSGHHFSKQSVHLIIRIAGAGWMDINIYSKTDKKFIKVLFHKQWTMTYVNDTIRDINGDNNNDFVVNWYGSSGCCLKAFSTVYLLQKDKHTFSESFEFINPSFAPNEKIIRGVCYGQPGETEMYKYKWNGLQVDTLEFVSYERNDKNKKTGRIILSKDRPYTEKFKPVKVLNSVPPEYRKIEGYDWFTGN